MFHDGGIYFFKGNQMLEASYFDFLKTKSSVFWRDKKSSLQPVYIICGALVSQSKIEKHIQKLYGSEIKSNYNLIHMQLDQILDLEIKLRGNLTMASYIWKDL